MSEANELLENLSDAEFAEYSEIEPVNDILLIDALTRTINVPGTELLFGVETDKNVERKYFKCPRIVGDNIDLSTKSIRVHFRNANNETDRYVIDDIAIDGDYITFSWLVSEKVLAYQGTIYFTIVAVSTNADGSLKKEWNTTLASGKVLEGLEVELDEYEEEEARDVLLQLLNMLETEADTYIGKVRDAGVAQVSSIQAEGTAQSDAVAKKGGLVLASIPDEYSELNSEVKQDTIDIYELKRKKANAVTGEVSGESIYFIDAGEQPMVELSVFGRTRQSAYTKGYQLFDASNRPHGVGSNTSINVSDDGYTIIAVGGVSNGYAFTKFPMDLSKFAGKSITMKVDSFTGGSGCGIIIYTFKGGVATDLGILRPGDTTLTTDIIPEDMEEIILYVYTNTTGTVLTANNTAVIKGLRVAYYEAEWERFSGYMPGPNPEYPFEMENVENPTIKRFGKNLFKVTEQTCAGVTLSARDDYYVLNGTAEYSYNFGTYIGYLPVGNYTLSANNPVHNDVYLSICDIYSDKTKQYLAAKDNHSYATSTANITKEADDWECRIRVEKGKTYTNYIIKPQLEFGSMVTDYEKTEEQTIELPYSLRGIPVSGMTKYEEFANYTDLDGTKWVGDYIDFETCEFVQMIGTRTLIGSEDWQENTFANQNGVYAYQLSSVDYLENGGTSPVICDSLTFDNWISFGDYKNHIYATAYLFIIALSDQSITTADAFKTYLASNPINIQYILAEPIRTPLAPDEVTAYRQITMSKQVNMLYNNKGAWIKLKYAKDHFLYTGTRIEDITLTASDWVSHESYSYYTQRIYAEGITENTRVDINPSPVLLAKLISDGTTLFAANEGGIINAYAIGEKPEEDMTIQILKQEVLYI